MLAPVLVMEPRPAPEAVQTVEAVGSAASVQVTAVLLVPTTVAVYCTVLVAVVVLTGTEAGEAGDEVTVTLICCCWPPPLLLGLLAIQPAKGNKTEATNRQDTIGDKSFRTGPSDGEKAIESVGGRRREVYSVTVMLSRSLQTVKWGP